MWPWPAKMAWPLFTVHSLQLHHTFHPLFTIRLPTATSENWLRHLQPPNWVPSLAQFARAASTFFHNNTSDDNTISFVLVQHHHRLTSSMSEFWAQLAWSGFSCNHCLFTFSTPPAISMFHQTAYWVAPLWSTCSPIVTYLTVMCTFHVVGGPAKGLLSLEHPKGWLDEINIWLIDWSANCCHVQKF